MMQTVAECKSRLDKMFHIIHNTLEHSGIMQNASYFLSNCVSIGHNVGGLLLFFMALYSERRSLVSCRITKAAHFLPLKSGIQNVYNFHGTSRCAKQYHSLKTSVILWPTMAFFPKHKPKASLRLIKVKLFQPGVSKHSFVQPSLHWVNSTSLLPCKVWVGVAGSSGFLVVLTELT